MRPVTLEPHPSHRVVLIANYLPDRQASMLRLARLFGESLTTRGMEVEVLRPRDLIGRLRAIVPRFAKWLGYIDKYLLFPRQLRQHAKRSNPDAIYHIVDHSNAVYARSLEGRSLVCTCNDLLAIRSALGEIPENPTGWSGRILQRWILSGLKRVPRIVCISENTRDELVRLLVGSGDHVSSALLPLNYGFRRMDAREAVSVVSAHAEMGDFDPTQGFVLHVGGNQWYKNRIGVCEIYRSLAATSQHAGKSCPPLILAGAGPTAELRQFANSNPGLQIRFVTGATDDQISALYSLASVLLFPSLQEGFGWPIAEAMACGCPVVTTGRAPMTEVGGEAAVYISPEEVDDSARILREVLDWTSDERKRRVEAGLENVRRFSESAFIDHYMAAYGEAAGMRREARGMKPEGCGVKAES